MLSDVVAFKLGVSFFRNSRTLKHIIRLVFHKAMLEINSFPNVMFGTIYQTLRRASCMKGYVRHHVKTLRRASCMKGYVRHHVKTLRRASFKSGMYDNMYPTLRRATCIKRYVVHHVKTLCMAICIQRYVGHYASKVT